MFVYFMAFMAVLYTIGFEVYFRQHYCRVSSAYYDRNVQLARDVTARLFQNKIPFWLDYATLLGFLREDPINVWDHDTDFSVLFSDTNPITGAKENTVEQLLRLFNDDIMHAFYEDRRKLVQVRYREGNQGPHVDLWVWHELPLDDPESFQTLPPSKDFPNGARYAVRTMKTFDPDVNTQTRPLSLIFPLQTVQWAGMTVTVPFDAHGVAHNEFSRYGGTYLKPLVFRGDCLHNLVSLRWLPW